VSVRDDLPPTMPMAVLRAKNELAYVRTRNQDTYVSKLI